MQLTSSLGNHEARVNPECIHLDVYISGWLQAEFPPMSKLFEIYTAFAFFSSWYSLGDTLLERSQEINLSFIEQPLSSWKCRNDAVDAEQHSNSQSNKEKNICVCVCKYIQKYLASINSDHMGRKTCTNGERQMLAYKM